MISQITNGKYMNQSYFQKLEDVDRNQSLKALVDQKEVTCVVLLDEQLTVHSGQSSDAATARALKSQTQQYH